MRRVSGGVNGTGCADRSVVQKDLVALRSRRPCHREIRRCGFADAKMGPATRLKVAVEAPATTHELSVGKLQAWLNASGKTPREQAAKVMLREVLGVK